MEQKENKRIKEIGVIDGDGLEVFYSPAPSECGSSDEDLDETENNPQPVIRIKKYSDKKEAMIILPHSREELLKIASQNLKVNLVNFRSEQGDAINMQDIKPGDVLCFTTNEEETILVKGNF
eukprot:TRINITY_DN6799_c0_g1_i1.p1 TRINITY_DN6799_c0_g1~~TRINITY_DN6799_c0_g1_i1.p1  ORF type:complete len:122 (-),score=19.05 TRINITY_DN6799_c0_g1_i1:52-417(-)